MSRKVKTTQKHMTQENRVIIEKRLDERIPLCRIGEDLNKDPSTIAKEIKKHRVAQPHNSFNLRITENVVLLFGNSKVK